MYLKYTGIVVLLLSTLACHTVEPSICELDWIDANCSQLSANEADPPYVKSLWLDDTPFKYNTRDDSNFKEALDIGSKLKV